MSTEFGPTEQSRLADIDVWCQSHGYNWNLGSWHAAGHYCLKIYPRDYSKRRPPIKGIHEVGTSIEDVIRETFMRLGELE